MKAHTSKPWTSLRRMLRVASLGALALAAPVRAGGPDAAFPLHGRLADGATPAGAPEGPCTPSTIFSAEQRFAAGPGARSAAIGDFDEDLLPDLVVANGGASNWISFLLGNGDGTFQTATNVTVGSVPTDVAVADLDGDTHLDFVASNQFGHNISVVLGNGDGTFQPQVTYATGASEPFSLVIAELNGLAGPDVAVANRNGTTVSVFLNNGDGTLQSVVLLTSGVSPSVIVAADLDNNGTVDLVTANASSNDLSVFLGNGDGSFQAETRVATGQTAPLGMDAGDLNGDDDVDLVVSHSATDKSVLLLGNGDGTFQAPQVIPIPNTDSWSVLIADLNADFLLDVALARRLNFSVWVLLGNGDGTFQPHEQFATGTGPVGQALGDIDGDQSLDLITANINTNDVSVLTSNCINTCGDLIVDAGEDCDGGACCTLTCVFVPALTQCRASSDLCDAPESCDGSSAACPADTVHPGTLECRAVAGDCDVAELCDGTNPSCPIDAFEADTVECRAVAGDCDVSESCTGSSAACPTDGFQLDTVECRSIAGDCDVAESCTGSSAACPADGFEPDTVECRSIAGDCDVAESCTGSSAACPTDAFEPDSLVCRTAVDECDVAESCTGSSASCPADVIIDACNFVVNDGCCPSGCTFADDLNCPPVCGNGVLEPGEECDDGATISNDGCSMDCEREGSCCEMNGSVCDETLPGGCAGEFLGIDTDCVSNTCPVCGNGVLEGAEECDDGNLDDGDECDSSCDEIPPFNDDCATAREITSLPFAETIDCTVATTGFDGSGFYNVARNATLGDDGMDNDVWYRWTADVDCTVGALFRAPFPRSRTWTHEGLAVLWQGDDCGARIELKNQGSIDRNGWFGVLHLTWPAFKGTTYWIQLGDAGTVPGGGVVTFDLQCLGDLGCGNGVLETGEACDDGNNISGDGCSSECRKEGACCLGDGSCVSSTFGNCPFHYHWSFDSCATVACPVCGDGECEYPEECDDGNTLDGDSCSSNCQFEPPANDNCIVPHEISGMAFSGNVNLDGATPGSRSGSCNVDVAITFDKTRADAWYRWVAPADCVAELIVLKQNPITAVWLGSDCASLTEIACDSQSNVTSQSWNAVAGTTYWFQIGDFGTPVDDPLRYPGGDAEITFSCVAPACGNGVVEPGEFCDDNNNVDGDGCSANCLAEDCNFDTDGDGVINCVDRDDDGDGIDDRVDTGPLNLSLAFDGDVLEPAWNAFGRALTGYPAEEDVRIWPDSGDIRIYKAGPVGGRFTFLACGNLLRTYTVSRHRCGLGVCPTVAKFRCGSSVIEVTEGSLTTTVESTTGPQTITVSDGGTAFIDDITNGEGEVVEVMVMAESDVPFAVTINDDPLELGELVMIPRVPTCGGGLVELGEECDDGNNDAGDGCSAVCIIEPGFACDGEPSVCARTCTTAAECADLDGGGVTDDVCTWWECNAGMCSGVAKLKPSDMGGPLGDCGLDNFCSLADALHALTCFADNNGCDTINIDAGGPLGDCAPDGFCNLADALHALTCFAGNNTCSCGPSPQFPSEPYVVGRVTLVATPEAAETKAGSEIRVHVFMDAALPNFRAYQLHAAVSGGRAGALDLVDITIEDRKDSVFTDADNAFDAFNADNAQMLSGLFAGKVTTKRMAYLATFIYRASPDAAGTFVVDVLHGDDNQDQTFLVGAYQTDKIEVAGTQAAVITVITGDSRNLR